VFQEISTPHDAYQDETEEIINGDATNNPRDESVQIEGPEVTTSTPHQKRKSVFRPRPEKGGRRNQGQTRLTM
jgi:hypothetical protein